MAAHRLAMGGARVVLLEAGGWWDNTTSNSAMLRWPYQSPQRGAATAERPFGEFDACIGGWDLPGEPFTRAQGTNFSWWRARMLGGRTNHWGRISLRFGPDDFKRRSIDGLGDDWPISYDDLAPYYDRIDDLIGIFGTNENLPNHPGGRFQPPPRPRCYELYVKQACDRMGIWCIPARLSVITRRLGNRAPCHYCGQCNRGCMTNSNFSSPNVLLFPAQRTNRLRIITNAMAREVTVNAQGLATGVSYINTTNGRDEHVRARVVVLAASACETARLLLNSRSTRHPNGLANSSGCVGRYLTDTTGATVSAQVPALEALPPSRIGLEPDRHALVACTLPHHDHAALQCGTQRERLHVELDLTCLDLGEVEHVVDQREQVMGRSKDVVEVLRLFRVHLSEHLLAHHLREADDRVQRRPQLVGHVLEELRLVAACGLELQIEALELVVHAVHVRRQRSELVAVRDVDTP